MAVIKEKIVRPHLILCEGEDAFHFIRTYLEYLEKDDDLFYDFQAMNFGGNEQLSNRLQLLPNLPDYNIVKSITIIRDAEKDCNAAIQSVSSALKKHGFAVPSNTNEIAQDDKRKIAFTLFPALSDKAENGTLEDLYLKNLTESPTPDELINDINSFINNAEEKGRNILRIHKAKLYTYFALTDKYTSLKLAEAAKAGAFEFDCSEMNYLKNLLKEMCSI